MHKTQPKIILLVTARIQHQIDVVGPTFGSYSHQQLAGQGYDLSAFVIDWGGPQRGPVGRVAAGYAQEKTCCSPFAALRVVAA